MDISWDDITEDYLPWLSRKTGKSYRLMSEAEWEYAARAGTTTRYVFGDEIGEGQARFKSFSAVAVGSFAPSAFGLHDMHGNVPEWVQDCWNRNYDGAPSDGSAWVTGDCIARVVRGGSWFDDARPLRSSFRNGRGVSRRTSASFRVAKTLYP